MSVTAQLHLLRNGESGEVGLVRLTSATVIYLYSFSNRVSQTISSRLIRARDTISRAT